MNILVLNGSARKQGNTAAMVDAFEQGARESGHEVTRFNVAEMNIGGCLGCEYCHTKGNGECVQNDDMPHIYALWNTVDMIVLASPIYYGSFTGQLHSAIHRTYALGIPQKANKMAMILSSGACEVYEASRQIYHGFIQGYFRVEDCGIFTAAGSQNKSPEKLAELKAFGRSL